MTTTTPIEANKALVQRVYDEVFSGKNYDVLEKTHASDVVIHNPAGIEDEVVGRGAVEEYIRGLHSACPDLEADIRNIVAEDDRVATQLTYIGTHEGEYMGIASTGVTVTIDGMVFDRIENGKIADAWVQSDDFGLLQQLGIVERPGK